MVAKITFGCFLSTFLLLLVNAQSNLNIQQQTSAGQIASGGPSVVDEVVVESSLFIKQKPKHITRRTRSTAEERFRRSPQFGRFGNKQQQQQQPQQQYGQSQSASNAAANSQSSDPFGFGASAANAQAQAFFAQGPSASFGASSAGTQTQSINANRFGGLQNAAGASLSQTYTLPNGQTVNFASSNNFANSPGANANSRGSSVQVSP